MRVGGSKQYDAQTLDPALKQSPLDASSCASAAGQRDGDEARKIETKVYIEQPTVTVKVYIDVIPSYEQGTNVELVSMTFREEAVNRDLSLIVRTVLSKLNVVVATERVRNRLP